MICRGRVANGVVVLEEGVELPEGTEVKIETIDEDKPTVSDDPVYRLGELAVPTGVPDLALNIDHYLYSHPRVRNDQE